MMPISDDLMDLGPFMQEYVLTNPFFDSRTKPVGSSSIIKRCNSSKKSTPSPSTSPPTPQNAEVVNNTFKLISAATESDDLEMSSTFDRLSPALDNTEGKGHLGSNHRYAAMLRINEDDDYSHIKKWLTTNYTYYKQDNNETSIDRIYDIVKRSNPDVKKTQLTKAIRQVFPNCHKVVKYRTNFYIGLVPKNIDLDTTFIKGGRRKSPRNHSKKWIYHQYHSPHDYTLPRRRRVGALNKRLKHARHTNDRIRQDEEKSEIKMESDNEVIDIRPKSPDLEVESQHGTTDTPSSGEANIHSGVMLTQDSEIRTSSPSMSLPIIVKTESTNNSSFEENMQPEDLSISKSTNRSCPTGTPVLRSMLNTGKNFNADADLIATKDLLDETRLQLDIRQEQLSTALKELSSSREEVNRLNGQLHKRELELRQVAGQVFDLSHQMMKVTDLLKKALGRYSCDLPM